MRVQHGVDQAAALPLDPRRHRPAGHLGEPGDQRVHAGQADRPVEHVGRHAGAPGQRLGGAPHLLADGQGGGRPAHLPDRPHRGAAQAVRPMGVGDMAVQRTGEIGQDGAAKAERFRQVAHRLDVAGRELAAGENVEAAGMAQAADRAGGGGLDQRLDQRGDRRRPAVLQAAGEIRRRGMHDRQLVPVGAALTHQLEVADHVVLAGRGQRRAAQADQLGLGALVDGLDRRLDIVGATENGGDLRHRRGLQRDRLAEMADQHDQGKGGAALAAMEQRQGAVDAEKGQRRAGRRADRQRVDRRRLARHDNRGFDPRVGRVPGGGGRGGVGRAAGPRRRAADFRPYRVVQAEVDAAHQLDHAVIAGKGVMPLLIDVDPGDLGLERGELRPAAGQQHVDLAAAQHGVQLGRGELAEGHGVLAHQVGDALLVALGRFAHRGADHGQPDLLQRRHHRPGLDPAGVEQRPLAGEPPLIGFESRPGLGLLLGDQRVGAVEQIGRRAARHQQPRHVAQRRRGVGDAVERALEPRDAPAVLHLAGQGEQRLRAHHHVDPGPVGGGDLAEPGIAGQAGAQADAQPFEQRRHLPQLAGDVVFAQQIDVGERRVVRLDRADDVVEQRLAGQAVAEILAAGEARRHHRHDRPGEALGRDLADGGDVVADQRRHAGGVDKDRRRVVAGDDLLDRLQQLLLAALDDVEFLEIGGEAGAVEHRA